MVFSVSLDRRLVSLAVVFVLVVAFLVVPVVPADAAPPVAIDDTYSVAGGDVLVVPADHEFDLKWGTTGAGDGQFIDPRGLVNDGSGHIYVVDSDNDRMQVFTFGGTYVTQWGSSGSGDGQFDNPWGVAVAGSGNIYITDAGNSRVQKFTSDGTYVTQWGSSGSGDGQFASPIGVAVAGDGYVYVAEEGNNRVQKFTSDGTYVTQWGSSGSGDGQFVDAAGVAVDGSGNVYVTDSGNNRVQEFTSDGTYVTQWGSSGSGDGQFDRPVSVVVDGSGYVYVTDSGNKRVQEFTSDGTYVTQWGSEGSGDGQFGSPGGVAVDGSGYVYVTDSPLDRVHRFTPAGVLVNDSDPDGDSLTAVVASGPDHGLLTLNPDGAFNYTPDLGFHGTDGFTYTAFDGTTPSAAAVVTIEVYQGTNNPPVARDDTYVVTGGETLAISADHELDLNWSSSLTFAIAVDGDGYVYVADRVNDRVRKYTTDGTYVTEWGSSGSGDGQLDFPWGVAVDGSGYVYVADADNDRVQKFTSDGTYVTQWGSSGSGNGQFEYPSGIAADGVYLYVTDRVGDRVQKFTSDGAYVTQWGSSGSGNGQFESPSSVAVDADGYIYVLEEGNHRVQKFVSDGTYLMQWGSVGSGDGEFGEPVGIGVDADAGVYVADTENSRVQKFASDGTYLMQWGSFGTGDGQLRHPTGVAVDEGGFVYIADGGNQRVQKLTPAGVLGNDSDIDVGDTLTAVLVASPDHGSVTLDPDGAFSYTPDLGFHGTDTFAYTASDGEAAPQLATVTITVLKGPNSPPSAVDDEYHTDQNVDLVTGAPGVLGNDLDVDIDDALVAVMGVEPTDGDVVPASDGSFTYAPDMGFHGTDSFTYTASDGDLTDIGTVTIIVHEEPNVAPVAVDDAYGTGEGTPLTVAAPGVLKNDTDVNADPLIVASYTQPGHGTVTVNSDGSFIHTPESGFTGTDTFTYEVSDARGGTDTAMVSITVEPDDPFTDDDGSIFEDDIEWMAAQGITRGCNPPLNTMFCPDDPVTRGQMAAFMVRALGYTDDGGGDLFADDDGSVFEGDIDRLGTAGVTRGCNPPLNTMFCPDDPVTRGQMAAFLHRALGN